jgi:hypothetical protein
MEKMCMQHYCASRGCKPSCNQTNARKCWIECLDAKDYSGQLADCRLAGDVVTNCLPKPLNHHVPFGLTEMFAAPCSILRARPEAAAPDEQAACDRHYRTDRICARYGASATLARRMAILRQTLCPRVHP